jgi:uncharacterized membrane protein
MDISQFKAIVGFAGLAIEALGVLVVVTGVLVALGRYLAGLRRVDADAGYDRLRRGVGRSIIIGLEFLIAGDIVRTVVVEQSLQNLGFLAVIVLIRMALSFSLFVEVEGRWPWQPLAERSGREPPSRT